MTNEKQLYKVSWLNKRTGEECYEDFVEAKGFEDAIRQTKKLIRRAENGVAETDIEIIDVGLRNE